ncbi:odorant receptor 13a-like [Vespula squamosa]|uniref:Odorant receptor 13a-like n=1 Tax=Vespula squamosa TaxID=30214 RepID=A0ABD2C255_VESSQ
MRNSTSEYELSYRIKPLVKPYNIKNYVFDCIHEFLRIIMIISVQSQECFQYYRRSSPRNPKNNSRTSSIDKKNLRIEIFFFNFERYKCVERYKISEAVYFLFSCDELHSCDWYELSTMDMKSIWICTMRCSKPLRLTCAKFCILSVRTFIDGNHFTFNIFDSLNIPMFKWVKICHLFISFTDSK